VLRGEPASAKVARDFAHTTLLGWDLPGMAEDTQMVVSELVTNALRHGLQEMRAGLSTPMLQLVLLRHERRLVVVVTDPSDQAPAISDHGEFAEEGRGLRIVEALSGSWGWAPLVTSGKAVWAAFDVPRP
jgi:anti-sigma regulatory factor (Ser/Thr protein kinase)